MRGKDYLEKNNKMNGPLRMGILNCNCLSFKIYDPNIIMKN